MDFRIDASVSSSASSRLTFHVLAMMPFWLRLGTPGPQIFSDIDSAGSWTKSSTLPRATHYERPRSFLEQISRSQTDMYADAGHRLKSGYEHYYQFTRRVMECYSSSFLMS